MFGKLGKRPPSVNPGIYPTKEEAPVSYEREDLPPEPPVGYENIEITDDDEYDPEVLEITLSNDEDDPSVTNVIFRGAGFDVEDEESVLEVMRIAADSLGYMLIEKA